MTALAVTRSDVLVTLHVLAVLIAFGGAFAYPIWFRMIRGGTAEQRAFFHAGQARLGKFLITPAILVVFATGAYLSSDLDVWGEAWVLIPAGMLVVIIVLGGLVLGPTEERLAQLAERGDRAGYDAALGRVKVVTWLLALLVVAATFLMIARIPAGGNGGADRVSGGASLVRQAGCLSCHRIASEGRQRPGGDLSTVGAHLTERDIRRLLVDPPGGMPSYRNLPADKLDALARYLSGLR